MLQIIISATISWSFVYQIVNDLISGVPYLIAKPFLPRNFFI